MPIQPIDTLLALKAIALVPRLKESDKRVGCALIEHFNRRSGRCDPSVDRLADMTGYSTRTIMRATKRLIATGFFRVDRHGGYSNRNSYQPIWTRFDEVRRTWDAKFSTKPIANTVSEVSPASRQPCHLGPDNGVTQTYRSNLQAKTYSGTPEERKEATSQKSWPSRPTTPSREAARTAAEGRWWRALHGRFSDSPVYGQVIERIDEPLRHAATEAELKSYGAGIRHILDRLCLPGELQ